MAKAELMHKPRSTSTKEGKLCMHDEAYHVQHDSKDDEYLAKASSTSRPTR